MAIDFTADVMPLFEKIADDPEYQIDGFDGPLAKRMLMMIEIFRTAMNAIQNNSEAKLLQQVTSLMLGEMSATIPPWDSQMAEDARLAALQYIGNHLLAKGL